MRLLLPGLLLVSLAGPAGAEIFVSAIADTGDVTIVTTVDTAQRTITYSWDFTSLGDYEQVAIDMAGFPIGARCTAAINCVVSTRLTESVWESTASGLQLGYESLKPPPIINSVAVAYSRDFQFAGNFLGSAPVAGEEGNVIVALRDPADPAEVSVWAFTPQLVPVDQPTPELTSPATGQLDSSMATFAWTANGVAADEFWLYLRSRKGRWPDVFDSGPLGNTTLVTVQDLPVDGLPIEATVWYRNVATASCSDPVLDTDPPGCVWQRIDHEFQASGSVPVIYVQDSGGTQLPGATARLQWNSGVVQANAWWIQAGSGKGLSDYFNTGELAGESRSQLIGNLPAAGGPVHVRLWFRTQSASSGTGTESNVVWRYTDTVFDSTGSFEVVSPAITIADGSTVLASPMQEIAWDAGTAAATEWWVYAGSAPGVANYFNSAQSLEAGARAAVLTGLPANGSPVHVRLWYRQGVGMPWRFDDSTFDAEGTGPAFIGPANGGAGSSVGHFVWNHVTDGTDYRYHLYLDPAGSGGGGIYGPPGGARLERSGPIDGVTEYTAKEIMNGPTWARLWYRPVDSLPGVEWQFIDQMFANFGGP